MTAATTTNMVPCCALDLLLYGNPLCYKVKEEEEKEKRCKAKQKGGEK